MKNINKQILFLSIILLILPSTVLALPPCGVSLFSVFFDCRGTAGYRDGRSGFWYEGDFKNGKFHGSGEIDFLDGAISVDLVRFVGEFRDGTPFKGKMYYRGGGDTYDGELLDYKRNGQGIYKHADGRIKIGEWKDGKPNGRQIHYDKNMCILRSGVFQNEIYIAYEEIDLQIFDRIKLNEVGSCTVK